MPQHSGQGVTIQAVPVKSEAYAFLRRGNLRTILHQLNSINHRRLTIIAAPFSSCSIYGMYAIGGGNMK
jgi:hypothetical protein